MLPNSNKVLSASFMPTGSPEIVFGGAKRVTFDQGPLPEPDEGAPEDLIRSYSSVGGVVAMNPRITVETQDGSAIDSCPVKTIGEFQCKVQRAGQVLNVRMPRAAVSAREAPRKDRPGSVTFLGLAENDRSDLASVLSVTRRETPAKPASQ